MEKAIKDILSNGLLKINGSLWMEGDGKRFFGPGPVELLELIQETGSMNQAAKRMKMSYKKAWELINNLNSMSATPLVITSTGGDNGGGSAISDEARQLIAYHRELRTRFSKFLEEETARLK
ncbi:winged helix-turn-helix domain-containing protein [Chitinophaga agri]|uniref:LysR family transcriptional regulator n=1 Tax=Chitinophaga agri TaxID=2703787 RepID=A0A6B9ZDJ9_9BACT|nr:LysR family transcriptional regulator [Chitinophaga agri]QHS58583.1 LysR family transcriptional regulator [Chitinophaga agri]